MSNIKNEQKPTNNIVKPNASWTPRDIWGKVIIFLREHHAVALHIACGDITDVDIEDGVFLIKTYEDYLYQLLQNEENSQELKRAFENFGITNFGIVKKEKILNTAQLDLAILKEIVGDKLKIEGD